PAGSQNTKVRSFDLTFVFLSLLHLAANMMKVAQGYAACQFYVRTSADICNQ
ncbi:MAG: hypothetical protein ACI9Z7_001580, partial [Alteromonas macleodii]